MRRRRFRFSTRIAAIRVELTVSFLPILLYNERKDETE
ncbi:hypothetical protein ELI_0893 [Eubacterium callanderi]|uniref:Uncharacterized protein n=1 Tax=Eubacterium callanderi TaxID=53442 RepID=E3GKF8_9FIRM|nr:hypothetical protein ELI_0893 [Eubacterium callanderi]